MVTDFPQLQSIPKQFLPDIIASVQVVEGGLNNRNYLLNNSILIKEYLERDEKNDPVHLRYLRERDAFQSLNHCNYVPKLIQISESENQYFLSRKWLNGEILSISDIQEDPNCIIKPLIQLHSEQYSSQGDFDYFDVISRYLGEYSQYQTQEMTELPEYTTLEQYFNEKLQKIASFDLEKPNTRIHGDLVYSNIIISKIEKGCFFIDWEYTTIGTPLIDLSYLFTQNSMPEKIQNLLFSLYCEFSDYYYDKRMLNLYKQLVVLMSALWYALQAIRMKKSFLAHDHAFLSVEGFQNLAIKSFQDLKLD